MYTGLDIHSFDLEHGIRTWWRFYVCNRSCTLYWISTLLIWSVAAVPDEGYVCSRPWTLDWISTVFRFFFCFLSFHIQQVYLQLPMRSKSVVSSSPAHGEVNSIQHYVIKLISDLRQVGVISPGTPVSSTNKLTATISLKYFWQWR
jgi:hypothetical protein